ncbi:MAG: hypothetical protein WB984_01600 [Thermoplasmata archaeon]
MATKEAVIAIAIFAFAGLLTVGAGLVPPPPTNLSGVAPSSPAVAASHPDNLTTHPTANFSMSLPEPGSEYPSGLTLPPGATIQPTLRLAIVNYTPSDFDAVVHLPPLAAIFWQPSGQLRIPENAANVTISSGSSFTVPYASRAFATSESLNATPDALLSTQLVSVTSSFPWPSVSLNLSWNFSVTLASGGHPTSSDWSQIYTVVPDEAATLVRTSSTTLSPGGQFMACLAGPIEGRTFSLHAETVTPLDDFVRVNVTIPQQTILPYCWNETIPTWVPPQGLIAHIWCYERFNTSAPSTFLLYVIPLRLVAPVTKSSLGLFGLPVPAWLYYATLGTIGVGVALLVYLVGRRWYHRRAPPQPPAPGPGVPPPGGPPPRERLT